MQSFDEKILKLAIPLRLSIMTLVSNAKVQVFEPQILEMIDKFVNDHEFTTER